MLLTSSVHIPGGSTLPMRGRYPPPLGDGGHMLFSEHFYFSV